MTDAKFTPSLQELRRIYVDATEGHREDDPDAEERAAEFDRAVGNLRAQALHDIAESYVYVHAVSRVHSYVYKWLRARAESLESHSTDPHTSHGNGSEA